MNTIIEINCSLIKSMDDFHKVFSEVMGFPPFYGKNMNAWIDCMTSLDCPEDGMTKVHAPNDGFLVLKLNNVNDMINACPIAYQALVDDVAFVNYRKMETGERPVLALSYFADPNR